MKEVYTRLMHNGYIVRQLEGDGRFVVSLSYNGTRLQSIECASRNEARLVVDTIEGTITDVIMIEAKKRNG
jgi:hypothetical protein